ncbi:hypothetical protein F2Q69_00027384 [Brassica cretica]|uniref:Uncharacterized protein n=1 Tax=Brassica cretica TaxID=69181 RepID=A0A8S9RXE6_BRACR|nr:hypothetical protein F2Q69_00027384 [Brassica cretica]
MKKKKPKKSPAKPSPKSSPPAKSNSSPTKSNSPSTKSNPAAIDPLLEDTMDGSDAQIGGPAAAVAHHSTDASDPHPISDEVKTCKTVIVAPPTDPSSVCDKEVMEVVPESSSEAPLTPTTVESEGSPNALVIMSELSSAAPLEFSKMDSESVKASKDVVNTSVSPLLATADAKTGSLSSQSAIDSKDATDVAKIHDLGALSVSSDRLVSDTITILEARENDLQKLQAPVNAQQEAVLNSGSEATETLAAKGTSVVPLKHRKCSQKPQQEPSKKKTRRGRYKDNQHWPVVDPPAVTQKSLPSSAPTNGGQIHIELAHESKLGTHADKERGETSGSALHLRSVRPMSGSGTSRSSHSDVQPDSSDVVCSMV